MLLIAEQLKLNLFLHLNTGVDKKRTDKRRTADDGRRLLELNIIELNFIELSLNFNII